jgi:uncharacterized protein
MGDVSNEPSMEEILSSIKRIIAEDSEASLSPPRARRAALVQPVADPLPEAEDAAQDEEVLELTETIAPDVVVEESIVPVIDTKPTLVSDKTAEASRSSLAALSALVVKPEVTGSDTLEGLVREMLKPMLAERMVAQEIRRIADRG